MSSLKLVLRIIGVAIVVLVIFLLAGTKLPSLRQPQDVPDVSISGSELSFVETKQILGTMAQDIVTALKNRDFQTLSRHVHPEKGVRFSPYPFIHPEEDEIFLPTRIAAWGKDTRPRIWGHYDGSGEPIQLTENEYFDRFVYDGDFASSYDIGYNERKSIGTMTDNLAEVSPRAATVEYRLAASSPDALDAKMLRLVFEEDHNVWYLVGIVHVQWTI